MSANDIGEEKAAARKAAQAAQLKVARAIREQVLGGRTPRQRGDEKKRAALDWVYRWDWASPSTVEQTGGAQRSGLASRLVKRGYLRSTRTESGGGERGIPSYILTLTEKGVMEVERFQTTLLHYELDPTRVRQSKLRHDQLCQTATLTQMKNKKITNFLTEKEMAEVSAQGVKQPDVCWVDGNTKTAIEIELTSKWGRDFDCFVTGCLSSLASVDRPPRFNFINIVSDSPAIVARYKAAFQPGQSIPEWKKDSNGKWIETKKIQVPPWAKERVLCKLIQQ